MQSIVYPNDVIYRLLVSLQTHLGRYGYDRVETPYVGDADLFLTKAGDQIVEHLFTFELAGRQWALRPEFTAAAAYTYARDYADQNKLVRWQFSGPVFNDMRSSKLQHYSLGAELIGSRQPGADAEVIAMAALGLHELDCFDYQVVIGHAGLIREVLSYFEIDNRSQRFILSHRDILYQQGHEALLKALHSYLKPIISIDDMPTQSLLSGDTDASAPTLGGRSPDEINRRLQRKRRQADNYAQIQRAVMTLEQLFQLNANEVNGAFESMTRLLPDSEGFRSQLHHWRTVLDLVEAYGVDLSKMHVRPGVSLAWDYYTGIVFEIRLDNSPIAVGGRYDDLIGLLGDSSDVPAVGFAYYIDALAERLVLPSSNSTSITLLVTEANTIQAIQWLSLLRDSGLDVIAYFEDNNSLSEAVTLLVSGDNGTLLIDDHAYNMEESTLVIDMLHKKVR